MKTRSSCRRRLTFSRNATASTLSGTKDRTGKTGIFGLSWSETQQETASSPLRHGEGGTNSSRGAFLGIDGLIVCSFAVLTPLCVCLRQEFCGAGSLCDLMAICERTLTEEQIAIVLKQSLYGLEYLHAKRKIHRDIKSGNILINHDGDCKLGQRHTDTQQ